MLDPYLQAILLTHGFWEFLGPEYKQRVRNLQKTYWSSHMLRKLIDILSSNNRLAQANRYPYHARPSQSIKAFYIFLHNHMIKIYSRLWYTLWMILTKTVSEKSNKAFYIFLHNQMIKIYSLSVIYSMNDTYKNSFREI